MIRSICRLSSSLVPCMQTANYSAAKTAIVMLNMGGPQNTDQVSDYLHRIMTDRDMIQLPVQSTLGPWIARRRTEEVKKKYMEIGGGSPILRWTDHQGGMLSVALDEMLPEHAPFKHYVAFRYVTPYTEDALRQLEKDGVERAVIFSQYPQYSCATTGSSLNSIYDFYKNRKVPSNIKFSVIDRWATHPLLARVFADRIEEKLQCFDERIRDNVLILFTAHSLPLKAYAEKGIQHMILVPIAFVNEHIETLHELDIEYCEDIAKKAGVAQIERAAAPNDHPTFIAAMADIVATHITTGPSISRQFLSRCVHCKSKRCHQSKSFFRELCKEKLFAAEPVVTEKL